MSKLIFRLLVAAFALCSTPAFAQSVVVVADCNIGISPALAVTGNAAPGTVAVDTGGRQCSSGSGGVITANATGTTGAVVGTFAATSGKTNYICGFNVQAIGGTATVGPITIAGLIGSSQVYQTDVNSATVGKTVASATFSPCIPASGTNTAITITTTANGTATAVDVNSWGYRF